MTVAYVDTSYIVAIAFRESSSARLAGQLLAYDDVVASNLLAAEFFAVLQRERVEGGRALINRVEWVIPTRTLDAEIDLVLEAGYLRGADCWHLACALYLAGDPAEVTFLTLDTKQRAVARKLGFRIE